MYICTSTRNSTICTLYTCTFLCVWSGWALHTSPQAHMQPSLRERYMVAHSIQGPPRLRYDLSIRLKREAMGGGKLEIFKFGVYLMAPVFAVTYFQHPEVFQNFIVKRGYIVYPPEDPRKPEELLESRGVLAQSRWDVDSEKDVNVVSTDTQDQVPQLRWRRYIFFGPRDDPVALELKRAKRN